jgi:hypothetical protein
MTTIRELIILEMLARAAVIVSTGSPQAYQTDIGAGVYRATAKLPPSALPCCVIWPKPETVAQVHGMNRCDMKVQVEGHVMFGSTNPSVVGEMILGDLIKCFTSPLWDRRILVTASPLVYAQPYADTIQYESGGYETPADGDLSVAAVVTFNVRYWTKIGDPCSR